MTAIIETAFVDGTDLSSFGVIEDFSGLYGVGGRRGGNYVVPGAPGEIPVASRPRAAYQIPIPLTLFGTDPTTGAELTSDDARTRAFNQKWLDLTALCDPAVGQVVLMRRMSLPSGVLLDQQCAAELADGIPGPTLLGLTDGRCVLTFVNLDGGWTDVPTS